MRCRVVKGADSICRTDSPGVHPVVHPVERNIDLILTEAEAYESIWFTMRIEAARDTAVVALFSVLFKYDIDNACTAAGGIIFRRGVCHYFYAFDGVCRNFVKGER